MLITIMYSVMEKRLAPPVGVNDRHQLKKDSEQPFALNSKNVLSSATDFKNTKNQFH